VTPSFLQRAHALLFDRARKAPELSTSVVEHEPIDEYVFKDLMDRGQRFRESMSDKPMIPTADGGTRELELAPDLWQDAFNALHNARPNVKLTESMDVRPDHQLFREIMGYAVEEDDFRVAKSIAKGDGLTSAMCSMQMKDTLVDALANHAQDEAEKAEQLREEIERMERAQAELDALREQGQKNGVDDALKAAMRAAAQEKADARHKIMAAVETQETNGVDVSPDMSGAAAQAATEAKEIAESWSNLPGTGDGDNTRMDPDKALALARRWRDKDSMRNMSILVGRFERSMKAARRKNIKAGREQRVGVTTGNDLSLTLPTEFVKLRRAGTRRLFLKQFVDRQLLQYDTVGIERGGLGPQVIVLDNSGSMRAACGEGVMRFEGAAAVAMALLALAHRDRRPTYIIALRSSVVGEWAFKDRTIDLMALTDFAAREPGGGTDLTAGMVRAEAMISHYADFRKADVVLITDGADTLGSDDLAIRDRLRAKGVQIHGVTLGMPETQYTNEMCDTTVAVTDLSGPSAATDHLAVATAG
jgi:uncharacterized protein with von Willebrand factor type A (vWA) domain